MWFHLDPKKAAFTGISCSNAFGAELKIFRDIPGCATSTGAVSEILTRHHRRGNLASCCTHQSRRIDQTALVSPPRHVPLPESGYTSR